MGKMCARTRIHLNFVWIIYRARCPWKISRLNGIFQIPTSYLMSIIRISDGFCFHVRFFFCFVSASIIAPTPKSNIYEVRLAIGNQRRSKKLCFNSNNNTTTTARTDCVNDGVVYLLGITNEFLFAYKLNITSSLWNGSKSIVCTMTMVLPHKKAQPNTWLKSNAN